MCTVVIGMVCVCVCVCTRACEGGRGMMSNYLTLNIRRIIAPSHLQYHLQ